jgi:hypothetical protein
MMMQTFLPAYRPNMIVLGTSGHSPESQKIHKTISMAMEGTQSKVLANLKPLSERLFDALSGFKVFTSQVAMHLDTDKRDRIFSQLNNLLDAEEWPDNDEPPEFDSYRTFLRLVLLTKPQSGPSIGVDSRGRLVAAWTSNSDRLTVECFPADRVRWVLSVHDDSERRTAAGDLSLKHFRSEIGPYRPERWFNHNG